MSIFSRWRGDEVPRQVKRLGLGHKPEEIRDAMIALEELGGRAVIPLIQVLLNQSEPYIVRCRAADTLRMLKDERAVEPLITTLGDVNETVRWHAIKALEDLGDRRAIPELQRIADSDQGELSPTPTLRIVLKDDARAAINKIESSARR